MGAVLRRGWRRRGVPVLRPIAAWSPVAATHRRAHPPPFIMRRRRAVPFIMIVAVVAPVGSSIFSRVIPKERRLPLALVGVPAWLPYKRRRMLEMSRNSSVASISGAYLDVGRPWLGHEASLWHSPY